MSAASGAGLLGDTNPAPILLLVGVALVAAAVAWRAVRLVRVRRGVWRGLQDSNARVRVEAVLQAAELSLATTAPALLRRVRTESDERVVAAIVETIAARQWEPASTGSIVRLRLWARAHVDRHPELRGSAQPSAPLLPGVAGAVPAPSLDPARAQEFSRNADFLPRPRQPAPLEHDLPAGVPDPDPLHPTRVLVTGAGGPAGVSVIRALRGAGHHVIAVDADPTAVGLMLADEHVVVPRFDDPSYLAALLRAATVGSAQALICTVAEEYAALAGATSYLEEAGVATLMPTAEAVRLCVDKWAFAQHLEAAGLPTPATNLGSADGVPGPWVVKPRFGRGSRDVHLVSENSKLADAISATPEPIVQTLLPGREFTADALVDASGTVVSVCARWRLETKAGISTKGETFDDDAVTKVTTLVLEAVGLVGPANLQGFVDDTGMVVVHEVNPRFSGGLPLTLHAGADVVGEYLRAILGLPMRPERLVARPGVRMLRHFAEVFEG